MQENQSGPLDLSDLNENSDLIDFWLRATKCQYALSIETDDPRLLSQRLYKRRDSHGDPYLKNLCVTFPKANPREVWIAWRRDANRR